MDADQRTGNEYLKTLSSIVDTDYIQQQWMSLSPPYDIDRWILPLPVWAKREYNLSSLEVWQELKSELHNIDSQKPICIYIHIPFCSKKCDFCDSYSFKVSSHKEIMIREYVDRLCNELSLWSNAGNLKDRPVSTVHLGGGTPNFIGPTALEKIAASCKENFQIGPQTEWALEATVEALSSENIEIMDKLGITRLHIGVQSLQDDVREIIGRQRASKEVLKKIEHTLALDWIVTVDLICGLPLQIVDSSAQDIQILADAGINGFSLYELLIYPQNAHWAKKHQLIDRSHLPNYFAFQAGALMLEELGYEKNLFNHWADDKDKNIYFTFPSRNEDCLAIGTIADGVFGDLHYRHPKYAPYMNTSNSEFPGLEGGLRRNSHENLLAPVITEILSGWITNDAFAHFPDQAKNEIKYLFDHWQSLKLIEEKPNQLMRLTTNGSWFAGNMIAEVYNQFRNLEIE